MQAQNSQTLSPPVEDVVAAQLGDAMRSLADEMPPEQRDVSIELARRASELCVGHDRRTIMLAMLVLTLTAYNVLGGNGSRCRVRVN